jgi:hypothetical protein
MEEEQMSMTVLLQNPDWDAPFFKVLAHKAEWSCQKTFEVIVPASTKGQLRQSRLQ